LPVYLVLPAALGLGLLSGFAYALLAGYWNARHVMMPLNRHSPNAVIVASLGMVLLLSEGARLALDTRSLWLPPMGQQFVTLFLVDGVSLGLTRLQILHVGLMLALVAAGHWLLTVSRAGRLWQAVCQDPLAARLVGVDADRIFVLALMGAASMAALGGLSATALYGTMDFGAGLMFGLKVVLIAAVGGSSHPLRSALGAAAVGFAEQIWGAYGPQIWRDAVIISALIWLLAPLVPSRPCSFFQKGAEVLRKSMTKFAPSKAACRCGAAAITSTICSPASIRPKRWMAVSPSREKRSIASSQIRCISASAMPG
jgi:branched-chain amino acid transport system permease protein